MKTQAIDVLRSYSRPLECKDYYFLVGNVIKHGTCVNCDRCHKHCIANAMTVLEFPKNVSQVIVTDYLQDPQELSFDEDSGECICESCGN